MVRRHPEQQYLDLVDEVLSRGDERIDRTGVGTRSIFGAMARFDLSDGTAPILTTKRVYWKIAVKEMLWFLTGQTNIQPLVRENVRIWTDWPLATYRRETGEDISQADFERRIAEDDDFAARWGDLGPVYGITVTPPIRIVTLSMRSTDTLHDARGDKVFRTWWSRRAINSAVADSTKCGRPGSSWRPVAVAA